MTPLVIKLGGDAAEGATLRAIAGDVAALARAGEPVLLVHGGGRQVSELQRALGQSPRKVAGRRVTDAATLDVLKMVVGGRINIDVCAALLAAGAEPVGLHGASALCIEAVRRPPTVIAGYGEAPIDLGLVGDVVGVHRALLHALMEPLASGARRVPVLACIGADRQGGVYNINADVVATQLALRLGARALCLVSDPPGVLRDLDDPRSRIPRIAAHELPRLLADGVVTEGMIPKLEESFAVLAHGVARIHVVGRLAPGDLARELAAPGSVGTVLVP